MDQAVFYTQFATRVRERREQLVFGASKRWVAQYLGLKAPHYGRIEAGQQKRMQLWHLYKLAFILETPSDYLLGLTDAVDTERLA